MQLVQFLIVAFALSGFLASCSETNSPGSSTQNSPKTEFTVTPTSDHDVFFPQQKPVDSEQTIPLALLVGELFIVDNCIRAVSDDSKTSYLIIWPSNVSLSVEGDLIQINDSAGKLVAQVGKKVHIGGGEVTAIEAPELAEQFRQAVPRSCIGPYWIAGADGITLG